MPSKKYIKLECASCHRQFMGRQAPTARSATCSKRCMLVMRTAQKQARRRALEAEFDAPPVGCRWLAITSGEKRFVFTLVDEDVFSKVSSMLWGLSTRGYAFFRRRTGGNVLLHHVVLDLPNDQEIDHINRDPLDNRRVNLRPVTHAQNMQNVGRKPSAPNRTGYLGVGQVRRELHLGGPRKFHARVSVNGERVYLGQFDSAEAAAMAYDEAARRLHGAFAQLNFPTEKDECTN